MRHIAAISLFLVLCFQCSRDGRNAREGVITDDPFPVAAPGEPSLEEALEEWPEMPQQVTFIGLKDCLTKFQVYWNGALSCFVGRDCFGHIFPPQEELARKHEHEQLHLTFAGGAVPDFPVIDTGQVEQSLLDGYLPVIATRWKTGGISYSMQTMATALDGDALDPAVTARMAMAYIRVTIKVPDHMEKEAVHFWLNFSGYRVLVPTTKELPDDVFPVYGKKLRLEDLMILDAHDRVRAVVTGLPAGAAMEFHEDYTPPPVHPAGLERSGRKGFLKNLLHIKVQCGPGEKVQLDLAVPYYPVEPDRLDMNGRDWDTELERVRNYWEYFYQRDARLETPDKFVNNFYRSGLWRTLVTADRDPHTGMVFAKSSPAWYETIWPNCAMVSAVSMDMRGHHGVAAGYLEPFIGWQSVRNPPNMQGASREGFLCPPEDYCAIPWVSNHGNILWALCAHYRITGDPRWAERITGTVLKASGWIIAHRRLTEGNEYGAGMLPGGTVSDDRGSGQYLCSDAQNYRGLRSAADFLVSTGHERAGEMDREAVSYRDDIRDALWKRAGVNDSVVLVDGTVIPYLPAEIHQAGPPEFDPGNFWPYINYIDVGPMNLVDCHVLESHSDLAGWIYRFESAYSVACLDHPISLTENWVKSIRLNGDVPACLLHCGVSTVEPFYSPRSTMFLENDEISRYLEVFYNQLAAGVSHRNLSPCENRYGVWHLPWADGEFHRMLLRMLVYAQEDTLVLLKAVPRRWLEDGREITVAQQPTVYGKIGFQVRSHLEEGFVEMILHRPERQVPGGIRIRFRHPLGSPIARVEVNGKSVKDFSGEYVFLGYPLKKTSRIRVFY
jgi:hypothetical protein